MFQTVNYIVVPVAVQQTAFSSTLDRNGRWGRNLGPDCQERQSGLRFGFFRRTVLSEGGTRPEFNECYVICVMRGLMADRLDLMSVVGRGSRGEVESF